jgi:hypothetical protein
MDCTFYSTYKPSSPYLLQINLLVVVDLIFFLAFVAPGGGDTALATLSRRRFAGFDIWLTTRRATNDDRASMVIFS